MHTTSSADCVDEFAETVTNKGGKYFYKYGNEDRPVTEKNITIQYRDAGGAMAKKTFTTYSTIHGPIVREADGKWIALVDHEHADRGAGAILRPHQGQQLWPNT